MEFGFLTMAKTMAEAETKAESQKAILVGNRQVMAMAEAKTESTKLILVGNRQRFTGCTLITSR